MGLIQRQILGELLRVTLMALSAVSALVVIGGGVLQATRAGLSPDRVVMVLPWLIPPSLPYTLPASFLFACTFVYTRLSATQEVTALKAAGIHAWRAIQPAMVLAVLITITSIWLTDRFIPFSFRQAAAIVMRDPESMILSILAQRQHLGDSAGAWDMTVRGVQDGRLIRPILQYRGDRGLIMIQAREATLDLVMAGDRPTGVQIWLFDGVAQTGAERVAFTEQISPLMSLPPMKASGPEAPSRNFEESLERASRFREELARFEIEMAWEASAHLLAGRPVESVPNVLPSDHRRWLGRRQRDAEAEIHIRLSHAASSIAFALLGCPICLLGRREFLQSFFFAFLPVILLYHPTTILLLNLFKEGNLPLPVAVLWTPLAAIGSAGIPLLLRVFRH